MRRLLLPGALAVAFGLSCIVPACRVTITRPLPVATVVDHLCRDDAGVFPCTKYSEQLPLAPPVARARAESSGFACAVDFCDCGEAIGDRPVHVVLLLEPDAVWLEVEAPRMQGESTRDLWPIFVRIAHAKRAQLGVEGEPTP